MDDDQLVERARTGDEGAVRALYRRHSARVYSVVRRLAGDDSLAEDWAQETWIRAIRSLGEFRGDSRFVTWLHRIAVNSALHGRRGQARRAGREAPLLDGAAATPQRDMLLQVRLERAIARLPEGMRRVLVLHDVEGYTHQEIGEMLGVSEGTCKSQLFKARAKMRLLLGATPVGTKGAEVCNT
jgi:RNA polymerase sigma-70 factor, ECF subfamily